MLHLKTAKLARWQVHTLSWSGGLLWASGIAWLILHNYGQRQGSFGPETNPAEPWTLRVHGAAMIAALLGSGSLLLVHIWRGWQYRSQRALGLVLGISLSVLIATGYLLYYVSDESWRPSISTLHWVIGLVILPTFVLHYRSGRRVRSRF